MHISRTKTGNHMIDILFTLALFCVFAVASLMVVLIGANVYQNTVHKMDANFQTGTSLTYVSTKVRQFDSTGSVYVGELSGIPALVLEEQIGGEIYQTLIYHYDGTLRELFTGRDDLPYLTPDNGQLLMESYGFAVEQVSDRLLRISAWDEDGREARQLMALQSVREGM